MGIFSTYRISFFTIFKFAFCPHVPLEIPVFFYLLFFSYYWKHEVFRHFVAFRVGDTNLLVCQYFVRWISQGLVFTIKWKVLGFSSLFTSRMGEGYMLNLKTF